MSNTVAPAANFVVDKDADALRLLVERSTLFVDSLRVRLFAAEDKFTADEATATSAEKKALKKAIATADSRLNVALAEFKRAHDNYNAYLSTRNNASAQTGAGTTTEAGASQQPAGAATKSERVCKRELPEPEEGFKDKDGKTHKAHKESAVFCKFVYMTLWSALDMLRANALAYPTTTLPGDSDETVKRSPQLMKF